MLWVDSILDKLGQKILNFKWKTDLAPNSDASKLSHVGRVAYQESVKIYNEIL